MVEIKITNKVAIDKRYSGLAETPCCLSCGGAVDLAEPQEGEFCVDLGAGRGQDAIRMAESVGAQGFAYGVDIADGMLDKARRNSEKLGVENVKFVKSELEQIDLPDAHIDLVISNCTINHAKDKDAVWNEICRILKPGGRFVVSDVYSIDDVPEEYRNDPEAIAECWAGAVRKDVYMKTLEQTGFSEIRVLEESAPYDKGRIQVASFTVAGKKPQRGCCCSL